MIIQYMGLLTSFLASNNAFHLEILPGTPSARDRNFNFSLKFSSVVKLKASTKSGD